MSTSSEAGRAGEAVFAGKDPVFSIIVPTYNRPAELSECLEALAGQTLPRERFEIVVVDDGSESPPEAEVLAWDHQVDIRLVGRTNGGPSAARNTGARHARGRFLAFTDDDCRPAGDWLAALQAAFASTPDALLGGSTRVGNPENPYSVASQQLNTYLYEYYNRDPERASFFASNNMAVPADHFRALGGFALTPTRTAEDRELCHRWRESGRQLRFVEEAVVYHSHLLTRQGFMTQHFHYGRGAVYFRRELARRGGSFRLEPLPFYLDLLRFPFRDNSGWRAWRQAVLLGLSQASLAAGFLAELLSGQHQVTAAAE